MIFRLRKFLAEDSGAVSALFLLLFPLLIIVGGLATDVTLLNAQKRYVQSQADLAAYSAARQLPDYAKARATARDVVRANPRYGEILLRDSDIILGSFTPEQGFIADANQVNPVGASAVQVVVPSAFKPMLLNAIMEDDALTIRRSGVGAQQSLVVFTLRNRLISVNTRRSLLDPVLSSLGLGLTASVMGYQGLANTRLDVEDLLGLVSTGASLNALTFNDVLDLPLTMPRLLRSMRDMGGLPAAAVPATLPTGTPVSLRNILSLSPSLARLTIGDALPNLSVNGFDLLMAFVGLRATPTQRVSVLAGLDLSPLASVNVSLGLIRPPVIAIGSMSDPVKPSARVSQTSLTLGANLLGPTNQPFLHLDADLQLGTAEAQIQTLNCSATAPADVLATFSAQTAPVELGVTIGFINKKDSGIADDPLDRISIAGHSQSVSIRRDQFRLPVEVRNPISLTAITSDLNQFLVSSRNKLQSRISSEGCSPGLLGLLGCSLATLLNVTLMLLLNTLNGLVNAVNDVLNSVGANAIVQALLDLLGIQVAQADIILDDYSCSTGLVH